MGRVKWITTIALDDVSLDSPKTSGKLVHHGGNQVALQVDYTNDAATGIRIEVFSGDGVNTDFQTIDEEQTAVGTRAIAPLKKDYTGGSKRLHVHYPLLGPELYVKITGLGSPSSDDKVTVGVLHTAEV